MIRMEYFENLIPDPEAEAEREAASHRESRTRARTRLSPREAEVLEMIERGLTITQIALQLELSVQTVKIHKKHVEDRLGHRVYVGKPAA